MRVATQNTYDSVLLDLQRAQSRQATAQTQLSSERKAADLGGFGREAETVVSFQAISIRIQGFMSTGESVTSRLETQDLALGRFADALQLARKAIADTVATGRPDTLMFALQGHLTDAVEALNMNHEGKPLFGGAQIDSAPVAVTKMTDLTNVAFGPWFRNDQIKQVSRIDENTNVETGMLASDLGQRSLDAFKAVQTFHESVDGLGNPNALTGTSLTPAQDQFLRDVLQQFDAAIQQVTSDTARNGSLQSRVKDVLDGHQARSDAIDGLIEGKVGVDKAEAIVRLQQAQVAVQASAQVLSQLRGVSLLDYLR